MSDAMAFFTADLHLGHNKVARKRGFSSTNSHDAALFERWCEVVRPDDSVWVLGDLSIGKLDYVLPFFSTWPGRKHLIAGNHDACHPMNRTSHLLQRRYFEVFESVELHSRFKGYGIEVLLSHFPYLADHTDPPRFMQWRLPIMSILSERTWLLHGHTHASSVMSPTLGEIHVGVDAWNLAPVPATAVGELINDWERGVA